MNKKDLILEIYKDNRTVFTLRDIAMLMEESDGTRIRQKVNYYVSKHALVNIRRGIYAKENFNHEELACKLYTPSYISMEYVLRKAGVIFQYDERITPVSYLSRAIEVGGRTLVYRKIKASALLNLSGILRLGNGVNIATPERALLDTLYLYKDYHFDHLNGIDREKALKILPVYQSKQLAKRAESLLSLNSTNIT